MSIALQVTNLTKYFGGLCAVDKVNMSVEQGEIVGLIGPNGAGKTTLFNCIVGYYSPTSGEVRALGQSITGKKPDWVCQMGVARTFQVMRSVGQMNVVENVMVGAFCRTHNVKEAQTKAIQILDLVGLTDKCNSSPSNLTVGDLRRLEIARALATGPKILLLDETMAGLTPIEAQQMVNLIQTIRNSGITLIIVEHVMDILVSLAERLIVLDSGQKIAEGLPQEVLSNQKVIEAYLGKQSE